MLVHGRVFQATFPAGVAGPRSVGYSDGPRQIVELGAYDVFEREHLPESESDVLRVQRNAQPARAKKAASHNVGAAWSKKPQPAGRSDRSMSILPGRIHTPCVSVR